MNADWRGLQHAPRREGTPYQNKGLN